MKKKTDLILIILLTLLIPMTITSLFIYEYGFVKIYKQMIRLSIILILGYFLYLEKQWARWIWAVLFYFIAILEGIVIFTIFLDEEINIWVVLFSLIALFHLASATYVGFYRKWEK